MKRNTINILFKILIFIILIFSFTNTYIYAHDSSTDSIKVASGVINTNNFKPNNINLNDVEAVVDKGGTIINVIRVIGIAVTCITLMLLGIKYMTGTVEEKADYKKTMIPYLIGVAIFFSLSTILTTIIDMVADF